MQLTDGQRLRLGAAFIEHRADIWPEGEPAATAERISAIGAPGGSAAGEAVKGYLQRRSDMAQSILMDEFRRENVDAANVTAEDDRVAVIYRYLRASWEGSARTNLRLIAKAIVGRLQLGTLVADEFLAHADALVGLSRDEVILLATMYRHHCRLQAGQPMNDAVWLGAMSELEHSGWPKDRVYTAGGRSLRSGYVIAASAWEALTYRLSPSFLGLCKTVDFDDALRREASGSTPQ